MVFQRKFTKKNKFKSREYKIYEQEEKLSSLPRSLYEKFCNFSGKVLNIELDKKTMDMFQNAIDFCHLKTTPKGVVSFSTLLSIVILLPVFFLILGNFIGFKILELNTGIILIIFILPFIYYLYTYPLHLKKVYEIRIGSELITMIMYIAMYMRNTPNLEAAVLFASKNLTGPLAFELRKIMWDVEIGNYISMQQALLAYVNKWEDNKELLQSLELIISSMKQTESKRIDLLDESVNIILLGNSEKSKHFSQSLKTPVMVVNAMGIILPVLGLVMFPLISVFLEVGSVVLFIVYDIVLPIILYFIIVNILETRPSTFTKIDLKDNPELPPEGKFKLGKNILPAWPFGILVSLIFFLISGLIFSIEGTNGIAAPLIFITGIAFGFSVYYHLLTLKRNEIREKTRALELEFGEVLFQIGNQMYGGTPIEMSIEQTITKIKTTRVRDFFMKALYNMKILGMTFKQSFFDKIHGAVKFYSSKLIKSIMRTLAESSNKGYRTASIAMLSISRYLKDTHKIQELINDELSEPLASMKFQTFILSPLISGIVVTLTVIILKILTSLNERLKDLPVNFPLDLANITITNFEFVLVVSIYLLESIFILSYFVNGIEYGDDSLGRKKTTSVSLFFGFIIFIIIIFVTLSVFGPLIGTLS